MATREWDRYGCFSDYPPIESLGIGDTALKPPCRSPLAIIEALRPYVEEKTVCELGSALGDISLGMRKYAKHVIGLELDHERARYSKKRNLDTIRANAHNSPPLSKAVDVYYMWMSFDSTRTAFNAISRGTIIMAGELGHGAAEANYQRGKEVKVLDELHAEHPDSQMLEVEFDEGQGNRENGVMVLLIINKP